MEAVAMAGSRCAPVRSLGSLHSLCGDQAEVRRSCGVAFVDRSHESFYALRVRCGKKDSAKALRGRVAKVQELVKAQRELFASASSRDAEGSVLQIAMSDSVVERMIKNLQELQVEVESLNVKAMKKLGKKNGSSSSSSSSSSASSESDDAGTAMAGAMKIKNKKKKGGSSSSSSSSSSSESSDSNRGKAMNMRALRKSKVSATDPIPPVPSPVAMPSSLISAERLAAGISAAVSTSEDHSSHEDEPAIVAQIRALCNTASTSTAANTREIFTRGPIELKETPSGRVIRDTPPVAPVAPDAITSGKIEVCTVGKCRRGGSQDILASLQASVPESSNISVTSCKCMGKCKSSPNVRVRNGEGQTQLHSHVSVDDVDTLLAFHFGGVGNQMPVLVASLDSGLA